MIKKRVASYILLFVLVMLATFSFIYSVSICDAVLPNEYEQSYKDVKNPDNTYGLDYDWWVQDLGLDDVRDTIESWLDEPEFYNLEYFEQNPIVIAVIDSGVNFNHEIFRGYYDEFGMPTEEVGVGNYDVFYRDEDGELICYNAYADYKGKTSEVFNVLDDAPDQHGTHVCGIISILIHELNLEKYVKIMPIKASYPHDGKSSFPLSALETGIRIALQNGANVVNLSLSSDTVSYKNIVSSTNAKQAIFCAAAGNDKELKPHYPAASTSVVGVMGYTLDNSGDLKFYENSNYGSAYDICAPAVKIISANGATNSGYKTLTGTSMACPIVSFGAALAQLKYGALREGLGIETSISDITNLVKTSSSRSISTRIKAIDYTFPVFDMNVLLNADDAAYCSIELDTNKSSMAIDEISKVDMHLSIFPKLASNKGTVKWTVEQDGKVIKACEGFELSFLPLATIGEVKTSVVWTYKDKEYEDSYIINIKYADLKTNKISLSTESIVEKNKDKYVAGYEIINSLSGLDYVSPETVGKIMWYVNDKYASVNGKQFTYLPEESGEYTISAKLNGVLIAQIDISCVDQNLNGNKDRDDNKVVTIVLIVLGSCLVLALVVSLTVIFIKKRKANPKNKEDDELEFEADLVDLSDTEKENAMEAVTVEEYEENIKEDYDSQNNDLLEANDNQLLDEVEIESDFEE